MNSERSRLAALCVIWGVFLALAMTTIIVQGQEANFIILGVMAFAALVSTDSVMKSGSGDRTKDEEVEVKAKRGSQPDQLLALLDEDDLAELRARVKTRIMNRIEGGSDGELSDLDQLLAQQQSRPRSKQ